jgi:hypothetical protein
MNRTKRGLDSLRLLVLSALVLSVGGGCGSEVEVASCVPQTCAEQGRSCGSTDDGCGASLACGDCDEAVERCGTSTGVCECRYEVCAGTCCGERERCDAGQCLPLGWLDVGISAVHAPDERSVVVDLSLDPGAAVAEQLTAYSISSSVGALTVLGVSYEPFARRVTLGTERQKLGITYELRINTGPAPAAPLDATFVSADTARFWVTDFSDPNYDQLEVTADRVGVGTRSVLYVVQGLLAWDVDETVAAFDGTIYPTLTQAFYPAPDTDGNERVVLLGADGASYYGGYFSPVDLMTEEQAQQWGMHSNEKELLVLNVIQGSFYPVEVVPHELTHMLYHARHGFTDPYWDYHDEGLAECGVHVVNGSNDYAAAFYQSDPSGVIGNGLSLVHWTWAQYENYTQAYLFWIYLASRAGGVATLSALFDLDTGGPDEVDAWIAANLGSDFASAHQENLLASFIQATSGPYGYSGLVTFPAAGAPSASTGTSSVELEPFTGTFFRLGEASVDFPGTQGPNVVYQGVNAAGTVDAVAPFDVSGGALLAYNASGDYATWVAEHSGPDLPAVTPLAPALALSQAAKVSPAWLDPPPLHPARLEALRAWRVAAEARMPLAREVLLRHGAPAGADRASCARAPGPTECSGSDPGSRPRRSGGRAHTGA